MQWDLRGLPPERVETLPHPSVHMIFERNVGGRVAGVARGKFSRLLEELGGVFAVKFTPAGFRPFAGGSVSRFTDTVATVGDVFGAKGDTLERAVFAEIDDASQIRVVEGFLRDCRPASDETIGRLAEIVYAVAADRAILKVDDLVARYAINQRTLQRLFAKYVGVSPKWVIQRYRLHEAAEQLASGTAINQSSLALDLGYTDQAHFAHDFKAVVGTSPAAYARTARRAQR